MLAEIIWRDAKRWRRLRQNHADTVQTYSCRKSTDEEWICLLLPLFRPLYCGLVLADGIVSPHIWLVSVCWWETRLSKLLPRTSHCRFRQSTVNGSGNRESYVILQSICLKWTVLPTGNVHFKTLSVHSRIREILHPSIYTELIGLNDLNRIWQVFGTTSGPRKSFYHLR